MSDMRLPIWRTAWLSWRDGWRAMRTLPMLAAITFVLILAQSILGLHVFALDKSAGPAVGPLLAQLAVGVLSALLGTPLCIAFYRYLLLAEVTPRYVLDISTPRVRAFFAYNAALWLAIWFVTTAGFYFSETAGPLANAAGLGIGLLVMLSPAMLFPAIAVDASEATLANALRDLQPLRALAIGVVVLLSCLLVPFVLWIVFAFLYGLLTRQLPTPGLIRMASIALVAVVWSLFFMTAISFSAQLYRAWARCLGRPADIVE